ncbi:hypothetical protein BOTBODRAFT_105880 [Botryobasidium botryosum FD-172 SS1]|uniref:Uncharacterized protein n=1 Tax=Botryobasidium botryosum (strain FD-172 SS1) TaxID=930990 RepID=A0A067MP16_BOTB1|nr:hypothetical protein BOTBODRAFT_105880 [Botryobasidium botryosum FD-172 SS1]
MIELNANLHIPDEVGRQPLHHAAYWSHAGAIKGSFDARPAIMRLLLDAGAELEAKDNNGDTPLSLANENGRVSSSAIRALVEAGAELGAQNAYGNTPLLLSAMQGSAPTVRLLLLVGADPRSRSPNRSTPLHFAFALMGHPEGPAAISALLATVGMDINAKDRDGRTPLCRAVFHGSSPAIRVLQGAGAQPSPRYFPSSVDPVQLLAEAMRNEDGVQIADLLLQTGLKPDARGASGLTPIQFAISIRSLPLLRRLLSHTVGLSVRSM